MNSVRSRVAELDTLAFDYDGTLASNGVISEPTRLALANCVRHGVKLILATGRALHDVRTIVNDLALFQWVVAENGAVLFEPHSGRTVDLGAPPPAPLLEQLAAMNIPYGMGRIVVGISAAHAPAVQRVLNRERLQLHIVLNKDSAMILPRAVTKGSGLAQALRVTNREHAKVGAFGDAENDLSLFDHAAVAIAPGNSLDAVKRAAHLVLDEANGAGVSRFLTVHWPVRGGH